MPVPLLHGVPTEYDVCTEWDAVDELEPISSHIGQQCIQMKANILRDWNIDALFPKTINLIETPSLLTLYIHMLLSMMKFVMLI